MKIMDNLMKHNKAQQAFPGFRTLMMWVLIIAIGIILLIIIGKTSSVGWEVWEKITNIFPFG